MGEGLGIIFLLQAKGILLKHMLRRTLVLFSFVEQNCDPKTTSQKTSMRWFGKYFEQ